MHINHVLKKSKTCGRKILQEDELTNILSTKSSQEFFGDEFPPYCHYHSIVLCVRPVSSLLEWGEVGTSSGEASAPGETGSHLVKACQEGYVFFLFWI